MARTGRPRIEIIGAKSFERHVDRALRIMPAELQHSLVRVVNGIKPEIQRRMEGLFTLPRGPKSKTHKARSGALKRSVKTEIAYHEAKIIVGGDTAKVPYAGWWEFGGNTHTSRGNTEREFIHRGRTIYPTMVDRHAQIRHEMEKFVDLTTYSIRYGD